MEQKGYSRRDFLQFCAAAATAAGFGQTGVCAGCLCVREERKAAVVWMHFQECTCCSESFIRASHPIVLDALLDVLSLNYSETLMAASGFQAEKSLNDTIANKQGQIHCAGGRRRAHQGRRGLLHDWRQDGGVDFADGGQGCGGGDRVGQLRVEWMRAGGQAESDRGDADLQADRQAGDQRAGLPADCRRDDGGGDAPAGAGTVPALDSQGRPKEFYGRRVHDTCYRRPNYDAGCLSKRSTTRMRARDIAFTRWAARGRSLTTPARW